MDATGDGLRLLAEEDEGTGRRAGGWPREGRIRVKGRATDSRLPVKGRLQGQGVPRGQEGGGGGSSSSRAAVSRLGCGSSQASPPRIPARLATDSRTRNFELNPAPVPRIPLLLRSLVSCRSFIQPSIVSRALDPSMSSS